MSKISVFDNGQIYSLTVVENLHYNHDLGCYAKIVKDENGNERTVKRSRGSKTWVFHKIDVRPLANYLALIEQSKHKDVDTQ